MPKKIVKTPVKRTSSKKKPQTRTTNNVIVKSHASNQVKTPLREVPLSYIEAVCSINDPFCNAAIGARYMDLGKVRSLPFSDHTRTTVSTLASGNAAIAFVPGINNLPFVGASAIAANVPTWAANLTSNVPFVNIADYRIISCGLIIRNIVAPLSASGSVRVRVFSSEGAYNIQQAGFNLTTYNCEEYLDIPLQDCKEVTVSLKRVDVTAKNFRNVNTAGLPGGLFTTYDPPGFQVATIYVDGAPASTAAIDVEFFVNYEIVFLASSGMQQVAIPGVKMNPYVSSAMDVVSSEVKAIAKQGVAFVATNVKRYAYNALSTALASRGVRLPAIMP